MSENEDNNNINDTMKKTVMDCWKPKKGIGNLIRTLISQYRKDKISFLKKIERAQHIKQNRQLKKGKKKREHNMKL